MNDAERLAIDPSFLTEQERVWERERWRRIGWGYPEEEPVHQFPDFGNMMAETQQIMAQPETSPSHKLLSIQGELRHIRNKINEHLDKKKPPGINIIT